MKLHELYQIAVQSEKITDDSEQRRIIDALQSLVTQLEGKAWYWQKPVKGIYLYGPVGRGKSYLVELFFNNLVLKKKGRMHFHALMQQVDAELRTLQGIANPLVAIAKKLAKKFKVLCIDEFLIHDIADAMIIARLLPELLHQGMTLVITANTAPEALYAQGLHRERFLSVITLLEENFTILAIGTGADYRRCQHQEIPTFIWPEDVVNCKRFYDEFLYVTANDFVENTDICIQQRKIPCKYLAEKAVWFDFAIICNTGRSQLDYLELADKFAIIFVSGVPEMAMNPVFATLFINFIDIMYDKKVKVMILAQVSIEELCSFGKYSEQFQRTASRLFEMQSATWGN